MGWAIPLRTASTPATKVVATAPMPGIITPSFPFAGSITPSWSTALFELLEEDFRSLDLNSTLAALFAVFVFAFAAADFFTFAIFRLLPYRTCEMVANQLCSRIR